MDIDVIDCVEDVLSTTAFLVAISELRNSNWDLYPSELSLQ